MAWRRRINWLAQIKKRNAEVAQLRAEGYLARGSCIVRREELAAARERKRLAEGGGASSAPGAGE